MKDCPGCSFANPDDSYFCAKCGSQLGSFPEDLNSTETYLTPLPVLAVGSTFADRYQIIEELGRGGMGRVYKVLDNEIHEKVALKILRPEISADRRIIERFRNELKYARKLRHKNVCHMYDLMKEQGTYFITMEYVSGEDLKSTINRVGLLSEGKALNITGQICHGLAEAHRHGLIHRDLKPHNIMIDKSGEVRVMDFGIARPLESTGLTQSGTIVGTPEYMSPEQAVGDPVDKRSDIYSLGIILFELVTGKVPFKGDTAVGVALKHKTEAPPEPSSLNPQISSELNRMILKCLAKDKGRRFQSVDELLEEIARIERGQPRTDPVLPEKKTSVEIRRRRFPALAVLMGFLAVAALGIGGYFLLWPDKDIGVGFSLDTSPQGARVFLDDEPLGTTPLERQIVPGTFRIKIEKEGYVTKSENLSINSDFEVTYELEPVPQLYGILQVSSLPEGAEVYIAGEKRGTTPLKQEMEPGQYQMELRLPGFRAFKEEITITLGQSLLRDCRLDPVPASEYLVSITSRPSEADVYIDGRFQGKTPITDLRAAQRNVQVRVSKNDFQTQSGALTLNPGRNEKHFVLNRNVFTLTIVSDPPGAQVSHGDEDWGQTPLDREVESGRYRLLVRKDGYGPEETSIELTKDFRTVVDLAPLATVPVQIRASPKANVVVNGRLIGEIPPTQDLRIQEGELTIDFILPDTGKQYSVKMTIVPGEDWELRISMDSGRLIRINRVTGERTSQVLTPIK